MRLADCRRGGEHGNETGNAHLALGERVNRNGRNRGQGRGAGRVVSRACLRAASSPPLLDCSQSTAVTVVFEQSTKNNAKSESRFAHLFCLKRAGSFLSPNMACPRQAILQSHSLQQGTAACSSFSRAD